MKYIFILGNSKSTIQHKNLSAHIGKYLKESGKNVTYMKVDSHLNYNVGRMNPYACGEIYVLSDGSEVNLDLGIFERMCKVLLTKDNYLTFGSLLYKAIQNERKGYYTSGILTFEDVILNSIKNQIEILSKTEVYDLMQDSFLHPDVLIVDLNFSFSKSFSFILFERIIKQFPHEDSLVFSIEKLCYDGWTKHDCSLNTLGTVLSNNQFISLKHSFNESNSLFLVKNFATGEELQFADVTFEELLFNHLADVLVKSMDIHISKLISPPPKDLSPKPLKKIGIITRYPKEINAYCNVIESLMCAADLVGIKLEIVYINYIQLQDDFSKAIPHLNDMNGLLLPGGFGSEGVEFKIKVAEYSRTNNIPFLGICLGFQLALIEFARNVLNLPDATSSEFNPDSNDSVITALPNIVCKNTGDDIYLGHYPVEYRSIAEKDIYKKKVLSQKFRHRYAFNKKFKEMMEEKNIEFLAKNTNEVFVMFKLHGHKFYAGVQYHPELYTSQEDVDPIFLELIKNL